MIRVVAIGLAATAKPAPFILIKIRAKGNAGISYIRRLHCKGKESSRVGSATLDKAKAEAKTSKKAQIPDRLSTSWPVLDFPAGDISSSIAPLYHKAPASDFSYLANHEIMLMMSIRDCN